jgi:hypothetical protein
MLSPDENVQKNLDATCFPVERAISASQLEKLSVSGASAPFEFWLDLRSAV